MKRNLKNNNGEFRNTSIAQSDKHNFIAKIEGNALWKNKLQEKPMQPSGFSLLSRSRFGQGTKVGS